MAYQWQSVEVASVTLGISTRTLHRRINKGEVETRLNSGRREVLVCLPDPEPETVPGTVSHPEKVPGTFSEPQVTVEDPREYEDSWRNSHAIVLAEQQVAGALEKVRRTELALAAFQQTAGILQREASRARISSRVAWVAVAFLSVGVYAAIGWTASKLTRAKADREHVGQQLIETSDRATQAESQLARLRDELGTARQAVARSEGELVATKSEIASRRPTTQPSTLLEKLAKLAGD